MRLMFQRVYMALQLNGQYDEGAKILFRYTTPTVKIDLTDLDFSTVALFRISFESGDAVVTKELGPSSPFVDSENRILYVKLTQEDTAKFREGRVNVQVKYKTQTGSVFATYVTTMPVDRILDESVM